MIKILVWHDFSHTKQDLLKKINPMYTTLFKNFYEQVQWLEKKGFQFQSLSENLNLQKNENTAYLCFDGAFSSWKEISLWLFEKKIPATFFIVTNWIRTTPDSKNPHPYENENSLYTQDIREIARMGHKIASHTCSHRPLIKGKEELSEAFYSRVFEELLKSRQLLQSWSHQKVTLLATPNGILDETLKTMIVDAGYLCNRGATIQDYPCEYDILNLPIHWCDMKTLNFYDFKISMGEEKKFLTYHLHRLKRRLLRPWILNKYKRKIAFDYEKS